MWHIYCLSLVEMLPYYRNGCRKQMKKVRNKGFTLIELLIAIAIIGILTTIAVPYMLSYSKRAHYATALTECKTVYNAFLDYYLQNSMFPYASTSPSFQLDTFSPLDYKGNIFSKLVGNKADAYDSPDDQGVNQEFWVRMTLAADTSVQFLISYSDNADLAPGQWLEGVSVFRDGVKINP